MAWEGGCNCLKISPEVTKSVHVKTYKKNFLQNLQTLEKCDFFKKFVYDADTVLESLLRAEYKKYFFRQEATFWVYHLLILNFLCRI